MTTLEKIDLAKNIADITEEDDLLCGILHHYLACLIALEQDDDHSDIDFFVVKIKESLDRSIQKYDPR